MVKKLLHCGELIRKHSKMKSTIIKKIPGEYGHECCVNSDCRN